jgi:NAD(P)-dependent dehydrogenase (short-subunit alcohol dehydrogenase family)
MNPQTQTSGSKHAAMGDFSGKVALVTGGSKGIGLACARALIQAGAQVAVVGRDVGLLKDLEQTLGSTRLLGIAQDLSQADSAARVVNETLTRFGQVDILVNSAGSSASGPFLSLPDSAWQDSFNLKIMATLRVIREILPHMVERKQGNIVSIAGNSALQPDATMLPSVMANTTLIAVTKALADSVAEQGVVLNCVSPGPTLTDRLRGIIATRAAHEGVDTATITARMLSKTPSRRFCEPDEIARTVLFLCSGIAPNLVGTNLTVDGGATR